MLRTIAVAVCLVGLALPVRVKAVLDYGWAPLTDAYRVKLGEETLSFYFVRPMNVKAIVESDPNLGARSQVYEYARENWIRSRVILQADAELILRAYHDSGVFNDATGPKLRRGVEELAQGEHPVILITKENDPFTVYATVTAKLDYGAGTPTMLRLPDLRALLPPIPWTIGRTAVHVIPREGSLEEDPALSEQLSQRDYVLGARAEIGLYATPTSLAPKLRPLRSEILRVVHRLLLANQCVFWGGAPLPPSEVARVPQLSGEHRARIKRLAQRYPVIPQVLDLRMLYPEHQQRPVVTEILVLTLAPKEEPFKDPWMRLYQTQYGFGPVIYSREDPDRHDAIAQVALISRGDFETRTAALLRQRSGEKAVEFSVKTVWNDPVFSRSPAPLCSLAMLHGFAAEPRDWDPSHYLSSPHYEWRRDAHWWGE
jgi:hypothetical protein